MEPSEQALGEKRLGNECFVKNEFEKAIDHYTAALDLIKDIKSFDKLERSRIYSNRAECHIRRKSHKDAISDCNGALKFDTNNIKARFRRAKANNALTFHKKSMNDLRIVLTKQPNNQKALELMTIVQRKLGIGTGSKGDKELDYDPETDVSWQDQSKIAQYSVMNYRKVNLEDSINLDREALARNKDARESKDTVLPEDDTFYFELGDCFFSVTEDETDAMLDKERSDFLNKIHTKEIKLKTLKRDMIHLRAQLKAKFGDHIGLPEIKG